MKTANDTARQKGIFIEKIYNLLVENFPQTFYVGGYVRDMLLGKRTYDIDIATRARPEQVVSILNSHGIIYSKAGLDFGVVKILRPGISLEVATFRTEKYGKSRYPKITFTGSLKADAKRRDFSINALYFKPKGNKLFDFFGGQTDVEKHIIRFIGDPKKKISEDPLRIVRALRFCFDLNFHMEKNTWLAVKNNFKLVRSLTKNKTENEIRKLRKETDRKLLKKILGGEKILDKYAKKFYPKYD